MSEQKITARTELDQSHYKTKIYAGGHFIYADEPTEIGGTDEGMEPSAILLASLGSCTAITMRMYADRKKYQLDAIRIELAFSEEAQIENATTIIRIIELIGNLTEEERNRLMQIADKCPVHKMLTNPIKVESSIKN